MASKVETVQPAGACRELFDCVPTFEAAALPTPLHPVVRGPTLCLRGWRRFCVRVLQAESSAEPLPSTSVESPTPSTRARHGALSPTEPKRVDQNRRQDPRAARPDP